MLIHKLAYSSKTDIKSQWLLMCFKKKKMLIKEKHDAGTPALRAQYTANEARDHQEDELQS